MTARAAAAALLLAVVAAVAGGWFALRSETGGGTDGATLRGGAESADGGSSGSSLDGGSAASAKPRKPPRNRAAAPRELTIDEKAQADAVTRLVVDAAAKRLADPAEGIRRMRLPGDARGTDPRWTAASHRIEAAGGRGAARPPSASLRIPRAATPELSGDARYLYGHYWNPPVRSPAADDDEPESPQPKGLRADYYDYLHAAIHDIPALAALPPSFTRVDKSIDFATDASFDLPFDPETFAVLWRGFLVVETAGEYEFTCGSDDGAQLEIGGTVVLSHRGLRPYEETNGRIRLDPGRHAFQLAFYENYVYASCRLFWQLPGSEVRTIVPAAAFEPPEEIAKAQPPVLVRVEPASGVLGDEVVLHGRGFSAAPALNAVTFAGVPAEVIAASNEELVVRVPVGASTGSVVVQVGPVSSRPRPFEVENLLGLYAEYFQVGEDITDYPDFDARAPYFVRTDGPVRFENDDLWNLPYDPDVFGARWTGYLYAPADDEWEITLGSDDGAELELGGQRVISMPGLQSYREETATVALTEGFHQVRIRYFENRGFAAIGLLWRRRGDAERVPIPRGFLFPPDAVAVRAEPVIIAVEPALPGASATGDELVIRGAGFGSAREYVRVGFPGEVWVRPEFAADDALRVRVPFGAGSGDLRVHAGVRASAPAAFTLSESIGLRGEFFELTPDEPVDTADLPGFMAPRSPSVTRIDERFRFGSIEAWSGPFAGKDFAARWTGTIEVETPQAIEFAIQSETAVLLRIDGKDVMSDLAPHTLRERFGGTRLDRGGHRFEMWTLHRGGTGRLHVFFTPYGRAEHLELPPNWLRPRDPR